jgi:hypothetical protein
MPVIISASPAEIPRSFRLSETNPAGASAMKLTNARGRKGT